MAAEAAGERLDRHLAVRLGKPRNQIRRWIDDGRVRLDGRPAKPATRVGAGDSVECWPPAERSDPGLEPEPGDLTVLYQDADLAVIAKRPGMVVHPGAGRDRGTLAHVLLDRYPEIAGVGGRRRPGIVHRLDKDTSGVLAVARSETAYLRLQQAFAAREVEKTYLAIAYGVPRQVAGEIALPIGRHRQARQRMAVRRRGGRPALTRYRCRGSGLPGSGLPGSGGGVSLFELDLETGRTHQIRVHLKAIGHPLVGDPVYGEKRWRGLEPSVRPVLKRFPRPALHAWRLAFAHPLTGEAMAFEAPVPEDLRELWRAVTGGEWPDGSDSRG